MLGTDDDDAREDDQRATRSKLKSVGITRGLHLVLVSQIGVLGGGDRALADDSDIWRTGIGKSTPIISLLIRLR